MSPLKSNSVQAACGITTIPAPRIKQVQNSTSFPKRSFLQRFAARTVMLRRSEVCDYLKEYMQEQGIADCFRFGVEVTKIVREAQDKWILHFQDGTTETFSFVVVCSGLYSSNPNMIDLAGRNAFEQAGGRVIHTSQRKNDNEFKDKNVVIVGNGRSAIEATLAAGRVAKETTAARLLCNS